MKYSWETTVFYDTMSVSEREQTRACSSRAANDDHDCCKAAMGIGDANRDKIIWMQRQYG